MFFEFLTLGFDFFNSQTLFTILHLACYLNFGSLAIFNFTLFKKLKTACVQKLKARFKCKESYEKVIYASHDNKP